VPNEILSISATLSSATLSSAANALQTSHRNIRMYITGARDCHSLFRK